MHKHPVLYEINTRVFLNSPFYNPNPDKPKARLIDVPLSFWESLSRLGVDHVWLMGIWKTSPAVIRHCCFQEGLINSYNRALKDWRDEDVIGSPYSIYEYKLNPDIATEAELQKVRSALRELGISLILDFVANHLSADSVYLREYPGLFIQCTNELYSSDTHSFFSHPLHPAISFAHGRDPFFPAWTDTAQLNYFNPETRLFMIEQLRYAASLCDGVRCDMAMLNLNNVFQNTWGGILSENNFHKPETEFWSDAISAIKVAHPDFTFIAEAYWGLEWQLQKLGFNYTYDKLFLDLLKNAPPESIRAHLYAETEYQNKSARFIENHDEERAIASLGKERSIAAAVIIGTVPGMCFFHDGQFSGKKIKLPLQLGREPIEKPVPIVHKAYHRLLEILNQDIFHRGEWELLITSSSWETNFTYNNLLAWQWQLEKKKILVVVNYSPAPAQCRIKLVLAGFGEIIELTDLWHNEKYLRSAEEAQNQGLFIDLKAWDCHILEIV